MRTFLKSMLATITLVFTTNLFATSYSILINAGSSGSRLHLFAHEPTNTGLPILTEIFSESVKPGISSFDKNPEAAGPSLKKLLDDAVVQLQTRKINPNEVDISVLATAGMRLLPDDHQQAIYKNIVAYINDHYTLKIAHTETISGQMEALYSWLDVNYLANNFNLDGQTIGTIDIGGASTEIAFVTNDVNQSDDEIKLNINGKTYTIFSKSFLGLGQDEARKAMNQDALADSCYPNNYPLNEKIGSFNFASCQSLYANVITPFNIANTLPALHNQKFIAFSGTYYDYHFMGTDTNPEQKNVESKIQTVCNTSWEQMQKDHPKEPVNYLSTYCANTTYITTLLNGAFQLQGSQLMIVKKINQHDIDWTLGALLFNLLKSHDTSTSKVN